MPANLNTFTAHNLPSENLKNSFILKSNLCSQDISIDEHYIYTLKVSEKTVTDAKTSTNILTLTHSGDPTVYLHAYATKTTPPLLHTTPHTTPSPLQYHHHTTPSHHTITPRHHHHTPPRLITAG